MHGIKTTVGLVRGMIWMLELILSLIHQEVAFKEWEAACLQTPACLGLEPIIKLKCVRKCMSPSCYHDLYAFDEVSGHIHRYVPSDVTP